MARAAFPWAFVVGLVAFALNLRAPFVAVAPITEEIRSDLGTTNAALGVVTSLPVLCFGLAAPLALAAVRRLGPEACVVGTLLAVAAGAAVRSAGPYPLVVLGSLVIGLGITVGNIVAPVLIRRDVAPARVGVVTGILVATMNVGTMLVSVVNVPLADAVGWRLALLIWGLLALVGLAAWAAVARRARAAAPRSGGAGADADAPAEGGDTTDAAPAPHRPAARSLQGWLLGLAFAGQATSYYGLTAWLPSILHDEVGLSRAGAGASSAVFQVMAVVGAIGVPLLALRLPAWQPVLLVGLLWITFPVILLTAPQAWLVGSLLGGAAQGGGLAAIFAAIAGSGGSDRENAGLSAFVQGLGYVVAAAGPSVLGLAHDATDAWTLPVLVVVGTTTTFTVLGTLAAWTSGRRPRPA